MPEQVSSQDAQSDQVNFRLSAAKKKAFLALVGEGNMSPVFNRFIDDVLSGRFVVSISTAEILVKNEIAAEEQKKRSRK